MKKARILILFLVIGLIVSLFTGCIPTIPTNSTDLEGERGLNDYDNYKIENVPYVSQGTHNWCLSASAAMVLSYYGRVISVEWIADNIDTGPDGARPSDMISYIENVLGYKVKNKGIDKGLSLEEIIKLLKEDTPIIALQALSLTNPGHHVRVIIGYDNDFKWLITHDPYYGEEHRIPYSDFEALNRGSWPFWKKSNLCKSIVIQTGGLQVEADVDPKNGTVPLVVHCVGFASGGPIPYTYQWEFGDGYWSEKGTGIEYRNLFYTYTKPGKWKPVLHVEDSDGKKAECTVKDIIVTPTLSGPVHNLTKDAYYATIQASIDDADNNNTIEVADGTYDESIIFPSGKKIILQSINGRSSTIIRGNNSSNTVTISNSMKGTTLEGFTVTHESGNSGRGIYSPGSFGYLNINNCSISNNNSDSVGGVGGGIFNYSSILTITASNISDNYSDFQGGGIYNDGGTITITTSNISDNFTDFGGGGIYNTHGGILTITTSNISDNFANFGGGGIYNCQSSTFTITGSTVSGNSINFYSGGIYIENTSGTCTIGGSSNTDTGNFNEFINNYKTGDVPSPNQHIQDSNGDCHTDYPYNYYTPDY